MPDIYKLKINDIINAVKNENSAYFFIMLYLFVEYARPQTLYPAIDIIPFGKIIISLCLIAYILRKNKERIHNTANTLMIVFVIVVLISSLFALSFDVSLSYWYVVINWMLAYYLITNIVNTERKFLVFLLLFLLCSFKMSQFSLRGWIKGDMGYSSYGFGGGPGWFHNSGEFGIQMCVYFPIAFYFFMVLKDFWPRWKRMVFALLPFTGFTGLLSSSNRGTLVGGAAVVIWMFLKSASKYKFKAIFAVVFVTFLAFKFVPEKQIERFQHAGADQTSVTRIENWKKGLKMAEMYPVLGVGYKNWQVADRKLFNGNGLMAHNIFIECVSELGYAGLAVFILLIFVTLKNNSKTRNLVMTNNNIDNKFIYYMAHGLDAALIGYLVSGFFVTVLYYPYFWINLSMTIALNNIAKLNYGANIVHDSQ